MIMEIIINLNKVDIEINQNKNSNYLIKNKKNEQSTLSPRISFLKEKIIYLIKKKHN